MKNAQLSLNLSSPRRAPSTPSTAPAPAPSPPAPVVLAEGAVLLPGLAGASEESLLADVFSVIAAAPLRNMRTPGGLRIAVAMSNCGALGWVSDRAGYRYSATDPESGRPWPALPRSFLQLARHAAAQAGFADFVADACLINRYRPGDKLSLHQDKNERDFTAPIVSVSLGLQAVFQLGGFVRGERASRYGLRHGDVVVFGGPARLRYHGILPIKEQPIAEQHPRLGNQRINLTLRKAG